MFSLRYFVLAAVISLLLGALLLLWAFLQPGGGRWIVVYVDGKLLSEGKQYSPGKFDDRAITEKLKGSGLTVVSESSQMVLLNDFNEIKQIPLDKYDIESFDPRNDGYAEALRSFFVQPEERRFFIEKNDTVELETILNESIGPGRGVLWRTVYPKETRWETITLLFFAAAFVLCAVFLGASSLFALFCIAPPLAFLTLAGPPGLAASGIMAAIFCLLREPLAERFRGARGVSRIVHHSLLKELAGWFYTFPRELSCSLAGFVLYWVISVLGGIPLRISLPAICFFIPLLLLPPWAESHGGRNPFYPLPARKGQFTVLFPPPLPVFTLIFAALVFSPFSKGSAENPADPPAASNANWPPLPGPDRYGQHAIFQQSFSRIALNSSRAGEPYGTYSLGPDGLISGFTGTAAETIMPPYPETLSQLKKEPKRSETTASPYFPHRYPLLAIMAILSVPAVYGMARYRKRQRIVI